MGLRGKVTDQSYEEGTLYCASLGRFLLLLTPLSRASSFKYLGSAWKVRRPWTSTVGGQTTAQREQVSGSSAVPITAVGWVYPQLPQGGSCSVWRRRKKVVVAQVLGSQYLGL